MEYAGLHELIDALCHGTKLHVGVLFLRKYGFSKLELPYENGIHASPVCEHLKNLGSDGYARCLRCRNAAIKKAMREKQPFGGICSNGVYEYTHPVTEDDALICIIYVGNILDGAGGERKLRHRLGERCDLLQTMEREHAEERCRVLCHVIESYIRMLLRLTPPPPLKKSHDPIVESIKEYIAENLPYPLSITELAEIFHYNEKYLGRLFKRETGKTFCEYINEERLRRAESLLCDTNESILSISTRVGFNNVTYFNRLFKKHHQKSPTEFRADVRMYAEFQKS